MQAQYQSFIEHMYIEAEVYDLNAVVGSVGGSLGLFLGFSVYQVTDIMFIIITFRYYSVKVSH